MTEQYTSQGTVPQTLPYPEYETSIKDDIYLRLVLALKNVWINSEIAFSLTMREELIDPALAYPAPLGKIITMTANPLYITHEHIVYKHYSFWQRLKRSINIFKIHSEYSKYEEK